MVAGTAGAAEVEAAIAEGAASLTALARVARVGMGRCRGRCCGPLLADLLHARLGLALDEHALFAPRPPLGPVPPGTGAVIG